MNNVATKIGVASTSSVVLTEALSLDTIWNALISLAVSVISVLAVEGIALLKAYIKSKKRIIDNKSKED